MESEKLRDEYFPQYVQLKESQKWIIIIPILAAVAGVITIFFGLDQKGIRFLLEFQLFKPNLLI